MAGARSVAAGASPSAARQWEARLGANICRRDRHPHPHQPRLRRGRRGEAEDGCDTRDRRGVRARRYAQVTHRAACVLIALIITGCASTDTPGEKKSRLQLPTIPGLSSEKRPLGDELKPGTYERSRLAIGEEKDLAQQRGEGFGFVPSVPLSTYVNRIRARLLATSGVTGVPGRAVVIASPAFAAYSTPDGNVYVAMGWLPFLSDEDEMAAIVAHELGHVLLTHHSADIVIGVRKRAQALHE